MASAAESSAAAADGAPEVLIDVKNVSYRYGRWDDSVQALDDVSWQVLQGSVMALIGPNGSGKSTMLNILFGLHPPDEGTVSVTGLVPWEDRAELTSRATFVSDVASLPKWIAVKDLARIVRMTHPHFRSDYFEELLDYAGIPRGRECGTFSKGQLAYIHLSLALAVDARLLILDEPTLGLDVAARHHFHTRMLADYCRGGRSVVVTTHYPDELIGLTTHAAFLAGGKLMLAATVDELARRYRIVKVGRAERERAEALGPLHQQAVFGGVQMLFDLGGPHEGVDLAELSDDIAGATLSDIYIAKLDRSGSSFLPAQPGKG